MNSRQRLLTALQHKEPDRVPYDLAGCHVTGIHINAYKNLCRYLGIDPEPIVYSDIYQQAVVPNQQILERAGVDTKGLFPLCSHNWNINPTDAGDYYEHTDEWGFVQHLPRKDGHYWSLVKSPIDGMMATPEAITNHDWPIADDPERIKGLRELAETYRAEGKVVMVKSFCAGLFEMAQRVRGMENSLCDLMADKATAKTLMDKILDMKIKYWDMVLEELGDLVDIVVETDDYGTQNSQLVSYDIYKEMIHPGLKELTGFLRGKLNAKKTGGEKGYIFLHSCGNVRPFIPSFIEMGIDIINPVHISADGMAPAPLKKDFGKDITFWGGGVETQTILPTGTVQQVKEDVKRNVEALMPGGGFVFNTVHNIQGEVPPENIVAMWDALAEYGKY